MNPVSDRVKKRLKIQTLLKLGWSKRAICTELKCGSDTYHRWKKRFAEGESEQDRRHSGRKRKVTPAIEKKIVRHMEGKKKRSLRKTVKWLKKKKVSYSKDSVHRIVKREGLHPYHRRKQPKLTGGHEARRVEFARNYRRFNWERTLMTDETEFSLIPTSNPRNDVVWARNRDEVPPVDQQAHSPTLRFWAGASSLGRTKLHFFSGNLNGVGYRKILEKALPEMKKIFGDQKWTFQHDGASAHKDKKTNDWLEENVPNFIPSGPQGEWPANSPDLNWMENILGL
jgi:transposase